MMKDFLLCPIRLPWQVYCSTHVAPSVFQTHVPEENPGHKVKTALQPFFDKIGIRKDLMVVEKWNRGYSQVQGTNDSTSGAAGILLMPRFQDVDEEACRWVVKQQSYLIKNNSLRDVPLTSSIALTIAAVAAFFLIHPAASLPASITVGKLAEAILSRRKHEKGDDLAISESSDEELKGGRRFFKSLQASAIEARDTDLRKIIISPEGDSRLDFMHPSIGSRLKKIERELLSRGVKLDQEKERGRICDLTELIDQTKFNIVLELKMERLLRSKQTGSKSMRL